VRSPPAGALLVTEVFPPTIGGSGVLLENLYARLDVPVTVLTQGLQGAPADQRGGIPVHHIDMRAPDWGLMRPSSLLRHARVARVIRTLTPAGGIVHCGSALPEGLSARLAELTGGGRYLCWAHGEELGLASASRELRLLMRRVFRGARAVLANSRNSRDLLQNQWGVEPDRIHVVYPGVDAERFHPGVDAGHWRARFAPRGETLFLSVGRLQRRKGHDLVLKALARWRPEDAGIRYMIAGDGACRGSLETEARALGVADKVTFLGAVDEAALPALYAACDVFLMPNRRDGVDFEGFGIVFLEAAASGRPAIGGRSGGVPEAVDDGVSGLLVGGEDEEELAAAMRRLTYRELRSEMGAAGRARVVREFTWERGARLVSELQERLCEDAAKGR
jgi:phosphatidyl-myo-inositol dimannoside synthase